MCRFTNCSRVKQNELEIFYTNNIYKFHVWVEVAMSVLSWFCIYASQLLRHSASLCKLHALKTQFSTNSSRQLRAIEFLPTSSWRWFQVYRNSIMQTRLATLKKYNTITTWEIQLTKRRNTKVMSSNFKLVSQLSRALGTDEDLTLLAVALVVISAGDHHVFGGVDLVVPGGSHPAQRQDLSVGLCCRLLRRLLPLPPSNLPRPRYSHLSGEDFFYHILITFPLYRLQLNTLMEWTIMRKNWEVSWVELNGFQTEWSLHFFQLSRLVNYMYWLSSLWTVKYRMYGTRVQCCSIIWSLGWFF